MNGTERKLIQALWAAGMPVKKIAKKMGYAESTILGFASRNRDLCPHRHKDVMGHDRTGLMIERVLAGRMTTRQAAKELGIPMSTMSEHVRNARKKR